MVGFEIQARLQGQHGGADKEYAVLNEQQSTLLLTYMRNSDIVRQFKKALVKAFYELKQAPTINPSELSRLQLIQMAMQAEQERIVLEQKVEILEPKAEALDRFATYTDGSFCIRDAAKTLQVKEKNFIQILYEKHWIYRRPLGAGWLAYSDKLQAGVMEHKITTGQKADGSEWANTQPRITARGLAKLAQLLGSNPTGTSPA